MTMRRIKLTAAQAAAINDRLVDYKVSEGESVVVRVELLNGFEHLFHKASVPATPHRKVFDVELSY
jgi:hypothetical protein